MAFDRRVSPPVQPPEQAARISDDTGFFLTGRLVEFSETKKIFTAPANRETEDYITGRFG